MTIKSRTLTLVYESVLFFIALGSATPVVAWSQALPDANIASSIKMSARISVSEAYTDNVFLSSTNRRSELITQVSPGIRIANQGGRLRGSLDYSMTEEIYARNSSGRRSQNSLNASGTLEAIDDWAFVDFGGVVGRQSISAFGPQSNDNGALNANSTETSTFRISPYVRGHFGSTAEYEARYSLTSSKSASALVSDVNARALSLRLHGTGARRGLGWSLEGAQQVVDYGIGRSTRNQRVSGRIGYPIDDRLGVYVRGSRESNDFGSVSSMQQDIVALGLNWNPNPEATVSLDRDNQGATGVSANWNPSKRTSLAIVKERRLYGNTYNIALGYRTQSTAWTYSNSRSVASDPVAASGFNVVDLYNLLIAQFAASELDPVRREQFASFLQSNGIRPGATALVQFQTSAVTVQRQQQLSMALFGARNTVTVIASRGISSRLDSLSSAIDDLSTSMSVIQSGLSINVSHRFSPQTVLNVLATRQSASGSTSALGTTTRSVLLNVTTQLTKDASAGIGLRRVRFDSSSVPFTETAVTGSLNVQF